MTICNPWTTTAAPSSLWRVQGGSGLSTRRITEAVALRRTEQGQVRIIWRMPDPGDPWTTATALPPSSWQIVGHDVRRTEEECERFTEDGQPRIVE